MATEQVTMYAVVQTGAYTTDGVVVPFVTPDGSRCPAVMFLDRDHGKCIRKRKRLLLMASRHRQLGVGQQSDMVIATPVLGVVPITVELPKKQPQKPATPSENGTPHVDTAPVIVTEATPTEPAKRGRKHHEPAVA